jgi:hypothetical protein
MDTLIYWMEQPNTAIIDDYIRSSCAGRGSAQRAVL